MDAHFEKKLGPDQHKRVKLNSGDPDPHLSEKLDPYPDPHPC